MWGEMPAEEKRRTERSPFESGLEYSLSILDSSELQGIRAAGEASDLSEKGIGFFTDYPLQPGHILFVRMGEENTTYAAVVRWMEKSSSERYRVGALLYK